MRLGKPRAFASLILALVCMPTPLQANPGPPDDSEVSWAYGMIVDSVTVTGNKHTRSHAILREMETQPGQVLDRDTFHRDFRFLNDMSPFSDVEIRADSLGPGHCALRIHVRERSQWLIGAVLPYFKYDYETGLTYGLRWREKNFRGRIEQLQFTFARNERDDENMSFGWSAPWIGWKHVSVGMGVAYFNRGDEPIEMSVLERLGLNAFVGIPLTESRIRFSQLFISGRFDKSRTGAIGEEMDKELSFSPRVGYRFDSRNSGVRPTSGRTFQSSVRATYPLNDGRKVYYLFQNEIRHFHCVTDKSVIALLSNFAYQFGDFPDYSLLRLGGPSSLRGYARSRFRGFHVWHGTVGRRYGFLPRLVFAVPVIHEFDIGLSLVTFLDSGIAWNGSDDFTVDNLHGTGGVGLRFYSPIRDVIRFDFGFSPHGDYRFSMASGTRF